MVVVWYNMIIESVQDNRDGVVVEEGTRKERKGCAVAVHKRDCVPDSL
jgi:hypothetical protein